MIGNTVEFKKSYDYHKKGVILDKFIGPFVFDGEIKVYLVDYYLIRLGDGSITKCRPNEVTKIISFYQQF